MREGYAQSSRSWWLAFGGPWWSTAAGRSPEPARVTHAPSSVVQELPVWPDLRWFFLPCVYSSLVFLSFPQSLPMIFADIMDLFLGLICSDQPSLFSSGAFIVIEWLNCQFL